MKFTDCAVNANAGRYALKRATETSERPFGRRYVCRENAKESQDKTLLIAGGLG